MPSSRLDELFLRISPNKFHYLKFILEGYDNLAILSSYQNQAGVVILRFPGEMGRDLYLLLASIARYLAEPR